uniref:Uncharacterized protein n=1 Tax=Arundo donax TaxID=35708 RepID=A0A0A8Z6M7_ARUDO
MGFCLRVVFLAVTIAALVVVVESAVAPDCREAPEISNKINPPPPPKPPQSTTPPPPVAGDIHGVYLQVVDEAGQSPAVVAPRSSLAIAGSELGRGVPPPQLPAATAAATRLRPAAAPGIAQGAPTALACARQPPGSPFWLSWKTAVVVLARVLRHYRPTCSLDEDLRIQPGAAPPPPPTMAIRGHPSTTTHLVVAPTWCWAAYVGSNGFKWKQFCHINRTQ